MRKSGGISALNNGRVVSVAGKTWSEKELKGSIREDIRPWGKFRVYPHGAASSLKIITVNPGASASLQYHALRDEFWVILDSGIEVTVNDKTWRPEANEEIFIPRGAEHRFRGVGPKPARFMELWIGASSEGDIVRIEDDYGRT